MLDNETAPLTFGNYQNCDDRYEAGYRTDGVYVYGISIGGNIIQVFCEFQREGNNWMVNT